MAASNAIPGSVDGYASKEYVQNDYKDTIRWWRKGRQDSLKWGFPIIRCSYSSQPRWEQYLREIRSYVDEKLDYKEDAKLREALDIPIIEDETLDGATWEQARDKFDAWVLEDLRKSQDDFSEAWREPGNDQLAEAIRQTLRDQRAPGAYYFTIVATGLGRPRGWMDEDDCECDDDSDEITEEIEEEERILEQRYLYQKFRASDYLPLYASILDDKWPDEYFDGAGGICSVGPLWRFVSKNMVGQGISL